VSVNEHPEMHLKATTTWRYIEKKISFGFPTWKSRLDVNKKHMTKNEP